MKINGPGTINELYKPGVSARKSSGETSAGASSKGSEATQVKVSEDASWIQSLQAELGDTPEVRQDMVDQVKAQLADGSFEASVDLDSVLDGLLADY